MFDFDNAINGCEALVADNLGSGGTLTTALGIIFENAPVIIETSEQVMGDDGNWSGRYAGNLGNGVAETHFLAIPISYSADFEHGRCVMSNGDCYDLIMQVGTDIGFHVYAAIKE